MTSPFPIQLMNQRRKKRIPQMCWMNGWTGGNWVQCSWVTASTSSGAASVCLAPAKVREVAEAGEGLNKLFLSFLT